jgi:CBS domain-containing protein
MKAGDVMTTEVVAIPPDTPTSSIASLLFKRGISAVPVVDGSGVPLGMVSEGDLMPRDDSEREARRDWWLKLLAEGEELNPDYLHALDGKDRTAQQIMRSPVVTVEEDTDLVDVAETLASRRIKRVPVVRNGRVVGIVSRADLVKAVARQTPEFEPSLDAANGVPVASDRLAALARHPQAEPAASHPAFAGDLSANGFRELVVHFEEEEAARREDAHHRVEEKHHEEARKLLAAQLSDQAWHRMLGEARVAAQRGAEEHLVLRFPCELCSDHGRAVNAPDPSWPTTLRGLAAQVFTRWKTELRPHGFGLHARVLEFPDGLPGDIGLFLAWGR